MLLASQTQKLAAQECQSQDARVAHTKCTALIDPGQTCLKDRISTLFRLFQDQNSKKKNTFYCFNADMVIFFIYYNSNKQSVFVICCCLHGW